MNYAQAARLLASARSIPNGKPIANHTRLMQRDGYLAVKYHNTDIIKFYPDGRVVARTGGWYTRTTKDRLNRYADAWITQREGTWYMRDGREFYDGIEVEDRGFRIEDIRIHVGNINPEPSQTDLLFT